MTSVCGLILEVRLVRATCNTNPLFQALADHCRAFVVVVVVVAGPPVDVGMSIDIASIDMVSEVNMVSFRPRLLTSCYAARRGPLPCDTEYHSAASGWRLRDPESVLFTWCRDTGKKKRFTPFCSILLLLLRSPFSTAERSAICQGQSVCIKYFPAVSQPVEAEY